LQFSQRYFFLVGRDTDCLETLVRVEALLAIQVLHKVSRSLSNRSSDAAGIDFCPGKVQAKGATAGL
jgi:hypothetical protein